MNTFLFFTNRNEFRSWLLDHHDTEKECFVILKKGKPIDDKHLWYLDAIEEALCFGWIDSTTKFENGKFIQRFSPRKKNSNWTELNKERARRLIKLGLMTENGKKTLPNLKSNSFKPDIEIVNELKKKRVWSKFKLFPPLYQRIRLSNLSFYKQKDNNLYQKMLIHTIESTKEGKTFGEWNDYGRLLNY